VPGFWPKGVEMTKKVAEVVRASRTGAGSGREEGMVLEMGKWFSSAALNIICSSGFGCGFCALESAFISGSNNTGGGSSFGLGAYKQQVRGIRVLVLAKYTANYLSVSDRPY